MSRLRAQWLVSAGFLSCVLGSGVALGNPDGSGFEALRAETAGASRGELLEESAIPLKPRGPKGGGAKVAPAGTAQSGNTTTTVVGALAVCLSIFFLAVWFLKRNAPPGQAKLPAEVLESLGRTPLGPRQHLQLLRVGKKLILLDVTPTGSETLTEITDPAEVERLVGLCHQARPDSATATFKQVLAEYGEEPTARGFLGDTRQSDWELANRTPRRRPSRKEAIDG